MAFLGDDVMQIQVYWRNLQDEIVANKYIGSWGPVARVLGGTRSGFQFALLQWKQGKHIRLYYQSWHANVVLEHCSDNGGKTWFKGSLEVGGVAQ